jgi:hypothetical protein
MTRMDFFLLSCQVFVFGAFIVVVAIHGLHALGTLESRAAAHRVTATCRWVPPLLLAGTSVLLTILPARLGHWILAASGASVLLCYPPRPSQLRLCWRLLRDTEGLFAPSEAPPSVRRAEHGGEKPLSVEPRRRAG